MKTQIVKFSYALTASHTMKTPLPKSPVLQTSVNSDEIVPLPTASAHANHLANHFYALCKQYYGAQAISAMGRLIEERDASLVADRDALRVALHNALGSLEACEIILKPRTERARLSSDIVQARAALASSAK